MCAQVHSAGSSEHTMQPGLLQLIMCNLQNFLPSVHLLYSLMPNLITCPWFHRQINFPGSMSNSVTSPAVSINLAVNSTWQPPTYWVQVWEWCFIFQRFTTLLLAHLNWTHWIYKNSSWWVWIIKQHWSKQLYLDQYYPYSDLTISFVRQDSVCG